MDIGRKNEERPLWKRIAAGALLVLLVVAFLVVNSNINGGNGQAGPSETGQESAQNSSTSAVTVEEDGVYDSRDQVALYIHLYEKLPGNYITKKEARARRWQGGSLEPYAPGKCIGGDRFGNREGRLPVDRSIRYYECDIDTLGRDGRGTRRIIYSDRGDINFTGDHYRTFTKLYDKDGAV